MADSDTTRIPVNLKLLARFFSKVRIDPSISYQDVPCWIWTAALLDGYARFSLDNGINRNAHRVAFEMFVGIIEPPDYEADHLYRNRACVNPVHIEAVSPRINTLRSNNRAAQNARKTHCLRGHEFTEQNTYRYGPNKRFRNCIACRKEEEAKRRKGRARSQCRNGHSYTTDEPPSGAGRHRCGICQRARWRRKHEKNRLKKLAH